MLLPMYNVLLPTYNEANTIKPLLGMLQAVFRQLDVPYSIVVVDDSSPDGTWRILQKMNLPNLKLIVRPRKSGLGSAYKCGIEECRFPYTIIMDSDLQHDPFSIIEMVAKLKDGTDIVCGTRYANGGAVCGWSFLRRMTSRGANNLAKSILGLNSTDLTGSFRIYKTDSLRELLKHVKCTGFGFQMEVLARAEYAKLAIKECPIIFYERSAGHSKMGVREIFLFVLAIFKIYFHI